MRKMIGQPTFIGELVSGMSYPVMFDPHYALLTNKGPVSLITGSPGAGKTFLLLNLAAHASLLGKTGIILDIKGDFNALKVISQLGYINQVHLWNLATAHHYGQEKILDIDKDSIGMLDPTRFTTNFHDNVNLTIEVLKALSGNTLTSEQINFVNPLVKDVIEGKEPSLKKIINAMLRNPNVHIQALGNTLESVASIDLAKLLSIDPRISREHKKITLDNSVLVVNLQGLDLPVAGKALADCSAKERVSVVVMNMLCQMVLNLMRSDKITKKFLMIDEAWFLFKTPTGVAMLEETNRLGRSLNLAVLLGSQSAKHCDTSVLHNGDSSKNDLDGLISSRFAFRNISQSDNEITCKTMGLSNHQGWEELLISLPTGQCLMQDSDGNVGTMHVMTMPEWFDHFDTNPDAKQTNKD